MSRTLFLYIFKDLVKIFLLTSGVLAGIMSFGGLLRPLTEHGLDAGQAARMLAYFMPAMSTYSLPIAALFATTMVYGRFAADNELTAVRAAGISSGPLSLGAPALLLGVIVAIFSLLFLCFIVPVFTLKVERVVYSNLAQFIANQIDRTHQFKFEDTTVYAQDAVVAPTDPAKPDEQVVTLSGLMIVSYEKADTPAPGTDPKLRVPRDFYFARQATALIKPARNGEDEFTLLVNLDDGTMFPRKFNSATQAGLTQNTYGPIGLESPIRENTKFWDIRKLKQVLVDRSQSREVNRYLTRLIHADQQTTFLTDVARVLNSGQTYRFDAYTETYELSKTPAGEARVRHGKLELPNGGHFTAWNNGRVELSADAAEIELNAEPITEDRFSMQVELRRSNIDLGDDTSKRSNFIRPFTMPMPPKIAALQQRTTADYDDAPNVPKDQQALLHRELVKLDNGIRSEMHSRVSFAVSCLFLVVVGFALGTMFRSGNFLSAFAVSVIPALLCIALIVAGQHTCENVPYRLDNFKNPLNFGLAVIWSGNAAVLALAAGLSWKLSRQ